MKKAYTTVLTIAGSDGSGGAGIQADIKTFAALECYGLSVITALTAQNTLGVSAIYPLAETIVSAQFRAITADISIDAVKIGMLGNAAIIKAVAALLMELKGTPQIPCKYHRRLCLFPILYTSALPYYPKWLLYTNRRRYKPF